MIKNFISYNINMLVVRHSTYDDLNDIENIFVYARQVMKDIGNASQWGDDRPDIQLVINDIENNSSYVVLDGDEIVGTFACIHGIEPTYLDIDGSWLDDDSYVTIHRIASNGKSNGVFDCAIDFASKFNKDIRIDTHKNNSIMLHLINKSGFIRCGVIVVDDGTKREAFQKKI